MTADARDAHAHETSASATAGEPVRLEHRGHIAALSLSTVAQQQIFDSIDLHEDVAAFLAKGSPQFAGH